MNLTDDPYGFIEMLNQVEVMRNDTKLKASLAFESGNLALVHDLQPCFREMDSIQECLNEGINES